MTDAAVIGRILREYRQRGIDPAAVQRLYGSVSGARVAYRIAQQNGTTMSPTLAACATASR
jgi:hypothetical protein